MKGFAQQSHAMTDSARLAEWLTWRFSISSTTLAQTPNKVKEATASTIAIPSNPAMAAAITATGRQIICKNRLGAFSQKDTTLISYQNQRCWMAEKEGFEPSRQLSHPTPLAGEPLRPLGYFSTDRIGGERGIRTPGAFRHHWFSRPAP